MCDFHYETHIRESQHRITYIRMETTVQIFSTQCSAVRGEEGRVVQFHLWEASPRGDPSKTDADAVGPGGSGGLLGAGGGAEHLFHVVRPASGVMKACWD